MSDHPSTDAQPDEAQAWPDERHEVDASATRPSDSDSDSSDGPTEGSESDAELAPAQEDSLGLAGPTVPESAPLVAGLAAIAIALVIAAVLAWRRSQR